MSKQIPIEQASLLEIAVHRVGWRRGITALTFAVKWGLWTESDDPNRDSGRAVDFARWAGMGESTAHRQLRTFRDAFPEYTTPALLWSRARERIGRNEPTTLQVAQLGALRLGAA